MVKFIFCAYNQKPDQDSRQAHSVQNDVSTFDPQQSPPSHAHPQLLFSSSHQLSPFQCGKPHLPVQGGGVGAGDDPHVFPISAMQI